ncbi:MAG: RNA polymerase sigma factor [Planctomycetota bacterium]
MTSGRTSDDGLAAWVDTVLPKAFAFARSLVLDAATAEDLVHDCMFRLWQRRERYDLNSDGLRLLFRAISNAAVDGFRRTSRVHSSGWIDDESHGLDSGSLEPAEVLVLEETQSVIAVALSRLSLNQRAALQLCSQGFSLREIAESLKVSEQNAGVLVHRARKAMEQMLAPYLQDGKLSGVNR